MGARELENLNENEVGKQVTIIPNKGFARNAAQPAHLARCAPCLAA